MDDHPIVRRGLRQLIEEERGLTVCGEAEDVSQALEGVEAQAPDLVIVDIALKGSSGLDLTRQLRERHPKLPVLVVSLHSEEVYAERALAAGAQGYVMKRTSDEDMLEAIRRALEGRMYLSSSIRESVEQRVKKDLFGQSRTPVDRLSDRELEVFRLIGQGYSPRHIAERLSISVKTVETHRQNLKQKLGVDSAIQLRRYAIEWYKELGEGS